MHVQEQKYVGLVADLMPNIRLMQAFGHFIFRYISGPILIRKLYSAAHLILLLFNFGCILFNLVVFTGNVNELTSNTITVLFFTHCITKFIYVATNSESIHRTMSIWNQSNTNPLFAESDNRYHYIALMKMRRLFTIVIGTTFAAVICWTTITFFGESVIVMTDPKNSTVASDMMTNLTETVVKANETKIPIPRLPIKAQYPWNPMSSSPVYFMTFAFQVYYLLFSMIHSNSSDVLFCSWVLFACEQIQHLKGIMKPLMELSASLDTYRPNSGALFRSLSASSKSELIMNDENEKNNYDLNLNISAIYSTKADWGAQYRAPTTLQTFNGNKDGSNPNGLTKKQEMMVRGAIKYWVERHKHVVRLVAAIGSTYGLALLLHMLTSTIMLTLLAYQATKIDGVNVYAFSVIGYLVYALAQVFLFCIFGNRLIEESSSVMEAAYSCHWYDGSEEAKTFVQIVCQQCQKAMTISGAKFFTVSLDLFASVLGAVVTYFMVLVQLK